LYFDLRDVLESPRGSAHRAAQLLACDPALAAKVLRVANSGFYGPPRRLADLHQAFVLLGADTVLGLVLAAHVFRQLPLPGVNLDALWSHSLMVAGLAKEIAQLHGNDAQLANTSAVAGLLHDIGVLVLLANLPAAYFGMVREARGDEAALLRMERQDFGVGHPELGGHMLSLWALPDEVVEAVATHHDAADGDARLPGTIVRLAESAFQAHASSDPSAGAPSPPAAALAQGTTSDSSVGAALTRLLAQVSASKHGGGLRAPSP
jgi:putative nucleotidyltransferase with HDIG domain